MYQYIARTPEGKSVKGYFEAYSKIEVLSYEEAGERDENTIINETDEEGKVFEGFRKGEQAFLQEW